MPPAVSIDRLIALFWILGRDGSPRLTHDDIVEWQAAVAKAGEADSDDHFECN